MPHPWPLVPLRGVLGLAIDAVPVDPSASYPIAGVYSFGRGLLARAPLSGSQTTYKVFHRLHQDDFVLSQLKGWEGALARVTPPFDGWFLSPQFATFRAVQDRLDIAYLEWYCKQSKVWEMLRAAARGMGARRDSVSPDRFLALVIPLPPLDEQRRIVARIEQLAAKIQEARHVQLGTELELRHLLHGAYSKISADAPLQRMEEVAPLVRRPVEVNLENQYLELGIRSFGKGTFHKAPATGAALGGKRIFNIEPGDLLFNIVFAWEGAVAVAKKDDDGRVGSHRFLTCVAKQGVATAGYLCFHFLTDKGLDDLGRASPGGAGRNRTLGLEALAAIEVPVPSYDKQLWFDGLQAKVDALKKLQTETAAELDALLLSVLDMAFKGEL